jgi:hypothetical protein
LRADQGALRTRQRAARRHQRQIEIAQRLCQIVADSLQRHLVDLLDHVLDGRLGRLEIDSSDCVCTLRPLAESCMSIPLACQNRVFGLTY